MFHSYIFNQRSLHFHIFFFSTSSISKFGLSFISYFSLYHLLYPQHHHHQNLRFLPLFLFRLLSDILLNHPPLFFLFPAVVFHLFALPLSFWSFPSSTLGRPAVESNQNSVILSQPAKRHCVGGELSQRELRARKLADGRRSLARQPFARLPEAACVRNADFWIGCQFFSFSEKCNC